MTGTLALTRTQIDQMIATWPRCTSARSGSGNPKRCLFSREIAKFVADTYKATAYQCGEHWHLTSNNDVADRRSSAYPARMFHDAVTAAHSRAVAKRRRIYVYGTRTSTGKWCYRHAFAVHRDRISRTGELS